MGDAARGRGPELVRVIAVAIQPPGGLWFVGSGNRGGVYSICRRPDLRNMQPKSGSLASLVMLHLGTFMLAGVGGWLKATESLPARPAGALLDDVVTIASNNLGVLIYLVAANVLLVGMVGVVLFAVNGYLFGQMLAMTVGPVAWVWLYAPVEILAFALGASIAVRVAFRVGELVAFWETCIRPGSPGVDDGDGRGSAWLIDGSVSRIRGDSGSMGIDNVSGFDCFHPYQSNSILPGARSNASELGFSDSAGDCAMCTGSRNGRRGLNQRTGGDDLGICSVSRGGPRG